MRNHVLIAALILGLAGCQAGGPEPTGVPTQRATTPAQPVPPSPAGPGEGGVVGMSPLVINTGEPFAAAVLHTWSPQPYQGVDYTLPLDLRQVANAPVLAGLTGEQRAFLSQNGFVVLHTQEAQFLDLRTAVSRDHGQPYFLTTDAAFHALHLAFDDLLKALERERLGPMMVEILQATLEEARSYRSALEGTAAGSDADLAVAYLSVALALFDPEAEIDPSVATIVSSQVQQILGYGGRADSVLFPWFEDDYGAYRPVGHYAGDPALERYFHGMTWFGRMHFPFNDPEVPPSRVPLIVTLALRRASLEGGTAAEAWATVHEVLSFMIGPSDDGGPAELAALMDQVYGADAQPASLGDDTLWQAFLARADELPAPRINSTFVDRIVELESQAGWRFLGQRFTMDGFILQNLIFDAVEVRADNTRRLIPTGLDVMAALGSPAAQSALGTWGNRDFPNYGEQLAMLQEAVLAQPESEWLGGFYDSWLYAFFPVLEAKNDSYPAYMQSEAWGYRELNSALGSWAELKHDTILYSKMPEAAGGGGPPRSGPAPAYVEPNPDLFYRLAYAAESLAWGLIGRGLDFSDQERTGDWSTGYDLGLADLIAGMEGLASRFGALGDIAVRELAGEPLTEDDYSTIQACLGPQECEVQQAREYGQDLDLEPIPVVAAVSGAQDIVLEVGVGNLDRIIVIVPLEGQMQAAQGGVFSYYEFTQPRSERLTDEDWRERLTGEDAPALPGWSQEFVLHGGETTDWLAFRVGDVYIVTEEGANLNLRPEPSTAGDPLRQLPAGEYVQIVAGPVSAGGYTWWGISQSWDFVMPEHPDGWVVENQEWFERAHGQ